jgi:hypothetical protein
MPQRAVGIPQNRERAALQLIIHHSWVPQTALHPAGEGTIASMLRKGWIEQQFGPGGYHNSVSQGRARPRLPPKFRTAPSRAKAAGARY